MTLDVNCMALTNLTTAEQQVVLECLNAAATGPFFPDSEFETLFGVSRADVIAIVESWTKVNETAEGVSVAINNSMNNLLGYPHRHDREWSQFISVGREEVARIFRKWRG